MAGLMATRRSRVCGERQRCPYFSSTSTNSGRNGTSRLEQMPLAAFQTGQERNQSFGADAVGGLPDGDQGLLDILGVLAGLGLSGDSVPFGLGRLGIVVFEQIDGVLAMVAGRGGELVEDGLLELFVGFGVTGRRAGEEFASRRKTHGMPHDVSPAVSAKGTSGTM